MAFNPAVTDRQGDFILAGAQGLGQGIQGGLLSIGDMLGKRKEQAKQIQQLGNASRTFAKAMGQDFYSALNLTPEEFDTLGDREATSAVKGWTEAQGAKRALAGLQEFAQESQRRQAVADNDAKLPAFMADIGQYNTPREQQPSDQAFTDEELSAKEGPVTLSALARASGKSGYRPRLEGLDDMLRAANAGKAAVQLPPGFVPTRATVNGVTFESAGEPLPPNFKPTRATRHGVTYEDPTALEAGSEPPEVIERAGQKILWSRKTGKFSFVPGDKTELSPSQRMGFERDFMKQIGGLTKEFETASPLRRRKLLGEIGQWQQKLDELDTLGAAPKGGSAGVQTPGSAKGTVNAEALIAEANKAIQSGADPTAVKKRLKEQYNIDVK